MFRCFGVNDAFWCFFLFFYFILFLWSQPSCVIRYKPLHNSIHHRLGILHEYIVTLEIHNYKVYVNLRSELHIYVWDSVLYMSTQNASLLIYNSTYNGLIKLFCILDVFFCCGWLACYERDSDEMFFVHLFPALKLQTDPWHCDKEHVIVICISHVDQRGFYICASDVCE